MNDLVYILIIVIPVAGYLTERYLSYLNMKMWSPEVPEKLKGIIDNLKYRDSQLYHKDNDRLSLYSSTFNLALLIIMIVAGGFAFIDNSLKNISNHPVVLSLIFFGIIGLASDILNIPFSWYDNFVIEKKYGFNRMTLRTFITDHIKSWMLAVLIGAPVLALITWFYYRTGRSFWLYAWGLITLFTVFINFFYSSLIVPLFNKQTPLEEGTLRKKIEDFAMKTGFRLKDIYVMDGSKRSTKANAYFSGFGSKKRIVLFDTLLKELDEDEIVAVLAHETGHYKKRHILQSMAASVIITGFMLFLFSLVVDNPHLSQALGAETPSFHMGLIVFGILYSPVSLVIGLLGNLISRRNEFSADRFAREHECGSHLASALKKLSVSNLSNLVPHPAYVYFHYSHPPLLERLKYLE
ncbi:MAG TPA: M48 family metallopeptidase [Bacteroidales bacterium]|nr:M48 family metallopeptidase [Bacteroidales bacterium]HRR93870.1 M48 family metallopeptidase [Bacteroidales bacterium]HRT89993.1 M48 family metallopeptidase [Bacteroidales bacterium]